MGNFRHLRRPKACAGGSDLSRPGMCGRLGVRWVLATCHGPVEISCSRMQVPMSLILPWLLLPLRLGFLDPK